MIGGTRFVGTSLAARLAGEGHKVTILTPALTGREFQAPCVTSLAGDPNRRGDWQKDEPLRGDHNVCSPCPVRNQDLGKAIGRVLRRPSVLPAPGFMIQLILGEFGSVLLKGQRVIPPRLLDAGFQFQYPKIEAALRPDRPPLGGFPFGRGIWRALFAFLSSRSGHPKVPAGETFESLVRFMPGHFRSGCR